MPFVSIMPQIARRSDGVTLLFLLVKKKRNKSAVVASHTLNIKKMDEYTIFR